MIPIKIKEKEKLESEYLSKMKSVITANYENLFGIKKKTGSPPCDGDKPNVIEKEFIDFLYGSIDDVLIGKPDILHNILSILYQSYPYCWDDKNKFEAHINISKFIKYIFNYEKFRESPFANTLAVRLNVKTCPYCNVHFTSLAKRTQKDNEPIVFKRLFQYDHFFPQTKFPFLSVSLYNLIPCCASCNNLKLDKNHVLSSDYHPHYAVGGSFNDHCRLKFSPGSLLNFHADNTAKLQVIPDYLDPVHEKRVKDHIGFFKIIDMLEFHSDILQDLAQNILVYYPILEDMKGKHNIFQDVFENENTLFRFMTFVYLEEDMILHRPLGKVLRDLSLNLFESINVDVFNQTTTKIN